MANQNTTEKKDKLSYNELLTQVQQLTQQNASLESKLVEAQQQLQEDHHVFDNTMESSLSGYWDWYIDKEYEYLSLGFKKMFGYTSEEMPDHSSSWRQLVHPEDLTELTHKLQQHIQSKGKLPFDCEIRSYHKNGYLIDVCCRGKVISWDEDGNPLRMIGVHIDISKLKQAERALTATNQEYETLNKNHLTLEEELRNSIDYQKKIILQLEEKKRRLKEVQQLTGVGYFMFSLETKYTIWSPEIFTQFGLDPNQDPLMSDDYLKMIHPEDLDKVREAIQHALKEKEITFEQRIIRNDGSIVHLKSTIKPWKDNDGSIIGIYGGSVDITDIKRAQEEIVKSEVLQKALFNSSMDALFIIDTKDDKIIECNEHAVHLFEIQTKKEIIGEDDKWLIQKVFTPVNAEAIKEEIFKKGNWSAELKLVSEKGKHFWGSVAVTEVKVGSSTMLLIRVADINEMIRLREILKETQKMAMIGGWEYDIKTRKITFTEEAYHMFALPPNTNLSSKKAFDYYAPEYQDTLKRGLQHLIKAGGTFEFEGELINAKNKKLWVRVIARAYQENKITVKLNGTLQDIDFQKRQELLLRSRQNELRAFVEAAPAAIAMFDRNLCYIAASEKWYEDYQLLDKKILGKSQYEIFPDISDEWKKIYEKSMQGTIENREEDPFARQDGSIQWLKWEIRPWYDSIGEIGGIIMFTEDITQRKKQAEELMAAKMKAEEASMAKAQFLSTMSHEIRTPMNAVIGMTHILLQEDPKPDQVENLQALRFSAENLLALINDILDFSKIEAGKIELEHADFSVRELIHGIKRSLSFNAEEKGLKLKALIDEDIPEVVVGDPTRLTQILINLVSNAIKFTEKGSVTLTAEVNQKDDESASLHIGVKDTGIGIPPEKIEKIFESFSQADAHTTRKYGGTGLGLAITKRLLELFGTKIQVESTAGQGAHFYFDITLKINPNSKYRSTRMEPSTVSFESLQGYKVLLVEDNQMNVLVAKRFLDKWQLPFDHAENGSVAVEMALQQNYDLILMDLQMPVMDGYEASQKIIEAGKQTPIIALTASAMLETQEKIYVVGMSDFITKPFNPNELYQKIRKHLDKTVKSIEEI